MKIYVSQADYLPEPDYFLQMYECSAGAKVCTFIVEADDLDYSKPVYITFETDDKFQVTAGPKDMVLIELLEFQTTMQYLYLTSNTSEEQMNKYIFLPQYLDYKGLERENEYILTTL